MENHPVITLLDQMDYRHEGERVELQEMQFFLSAVGYCKFCGWEGRITINKDGEVFHECNQGNVRAIVPTLELSREQVLKLLK